MEKEFITGNVLSKINQLEKLNPMLVEAIFIRQTLGL
jgi:hypothetical protein